MNGDQPGLIVICGATATGKSSLALAIAQHLETVILSADSRQVYRDFNIGTAKPSLEEQQQIPHYLLDLCDPRETLTVADYQQQAQDLIAKFHQQGKTPLLVGGTGLYIRAITQGLKIPRVPPQTELRSQLASLGQTQCYAYLQQVDPVAAAKIHPNDPTRTLRALEVYYVTGRPISIQQGENPPNYPILQIGIDFAHSSAFNSRIAHRTAQMVALGWLEEVEGLQQKYGDNLPLLETLGYQEMRQYLRGEVSLEEAQELTIVHTRQFAKRQRTWFRGVSGIHWFEGEDEALLERVVAVLEGR